MNMKIQRWTQAARSTRSLHEQIFPLRMARPASLAQRAHEGFPRKSRHEQLEAVVAEMRAYATAAQTGQIEIPQRWTSYN